MENQNRELEDDDRNVVDDLANKMTVASWMFFFLAAAKTLSAVAKLSKSDADESASRFVLAVIFFVFGLFTSQSATAFKVVVNSSSNQLPLLVDALRKLRRQYTVIYWLVLIGVLLTFVPILIIPLLVLWN